MQRLPNEMLARHAFQKTAEYFARKIEEKRENGQVAILVEGYWETLYFLPCNEYGWPERQELATLRIPPVMYSVDSEAIITQEIRQITVRIEKPLLSADYGYGFNYPVIFLWSGRETEGKTIPIEELNVKELLKVVQNAVQTRDGLIIDEALKNKIYK